MCDKQSIVCIYAFGFFFFLTLYVCKVSSLRHVSYIFFLLFAFFNSLNQIATFQKSCHCWKSRVVYYSKMFFFFFLLTYTEHHSPRRSQMCRIPLPAFHTVYDS